MKSGKISAGMRGRWSAARTPRRWRERIVAQDLNVREVEALVQAAAPSTSATAIVPRKTREKDPDTRAFEKEMTDLLGLKVEIKRGSGESGVLTIKYGNFDQLDYIRHAHRRARTGG